MPWKMLNVDDKKSNADDMQPSKRIDMKFTSLSYINIVKEESTPTLLHSKIT